MTSKAYKNVRSPKSWIHPYNKPDIVTKLIIFWRKQNIDLFWREFFKKISLQTLHNEI